MIRVLPPGLGKVLLQLLRDRSVNVLVACRIAADPRMRQCRLARKPLLHIHAHQILDKVLCRVAYLVPVGAVELEFTLQYLSKQIGVVLIVEWRVSTEQDVRDNANAPYIHCFSVRLLGEYLSSRL